MRWKSEGKLLARAAEIFNHPGEADRREETGHLAMNSLVMQKRTLSIVPGPSIPFRSHQGEREKNEYSYDGENTRESPQSKQIKL